VNIEKCNFLNTSEQNQGLPKTSKRSDDNSGWL